VEFVFSYNEHSYLVRVLPVADEESQTTIGMALALDITDRERAQREVSESRSQLERLSRLLLTAQEDERRRVAREVHDELGQALTAVKIGLSQTMVRAQRRNSLDSERRGAQRVRRARPRDRIGPAYRATPAAGRARQPRATCRHGARSPAVP